MAVNLNLSPQNIHWNTLVHSFASLKNIKLSALIISGELSQRFVQGHSLFCVSHGQSLREPICTPCRKRPRWGEGDSLSSERMTDLKDSRLNRFPARKGLLDDSRLCPVECGIQLVTLDDEHTLTCAISYRHR